ncbi:MAG: hypothetical protein IJV46_00345 [Acidaminococcaceae bacterium]|nr:hypothetical protein [Acidaminococcaceae bacterium]
MEMNVINQLLKLMEKAMEWLQELYEAARQGGFPAFSLLPQKTARELTTAHNDLPVWDDEAIRREYRKMLTRNRVRRCRERKKRNAAESIACNAQTVTENENPVTCNAKNVTCNAQTVTGNGVTVPVKATQTRTESASACAAVTEDGNAAVTVCNATVTPCNVSAKKEKENEKRKKQRKEINKNKKIFKTNIADAMPNSARAREEEPKAKMAELFAETDCAVTETQPENGNASTEGNCLPWQPPKKKTQVLIPTAELPDVYRKIVSAWNQLPLPKKFSGLYPSLVKRLHFLLENYGEEQIYNAIASISDSPFLLGKSKNNRGWMVSLNWMLEPEHFEKILDGEYHDDKSSNSSGFFQIGDELKPLPEGFIGTVVY